MLEDNALEAEEPDEPEWVPRTREEVMADVVREVEELLARPVLEETDPDPTVEAVFTLVHMARSFEYHLTRATRDLTMTALQARFAWLLAARPWPTHFSELQVRLGLSQPGVSRMISRMLNRGLVTCDISAGDPRNAVVELTELGRSEWATVCDRLRTIAAELRQAVGQRRTAGFLAAAGRITALDERDAYYEALRNPWWSAT